MQQNGLAKNPLIKKLRFKTIALTMAVVTLVLVVVFSSICFVNYQQSRDSLYSALELSLSRLDIYSAVDRNSSFNPSEQNSLEAQPSESSPTSSDSSSQNSSSTSNKSNPTEQNSTNQNSANQNSNDQNSSDQNTTNQNSNDQNLNKAFNNFDQSGVKAPEIGNSENTQFSMIPVVVLSYSEDGTFRSETSISNASISESVLSEALAQIKSSSDEKGYISSMGLYYQVKTYKSTIYYAIADENSISNWQDLALQLLVIGVITELLLFIIVALFSRWLFKPVENAWKSQQEFIANASHELKTPLTVILANLSILKAHKTSSIEDEKQWITNTESEALRMQVLVKELLDLAKNDAKEATEFDSSSFSTIDLSSLVQGSILTFESIAFDKGLVLEDAVSENISVKGNQTKLEQLVAILLDNACKYCTDKGLIKSSLVVNGKYAELSVSNDCNRLSEEDMDNLFERFYRTDKSRSKDIEGFGLGLSIAQQIVEAHKGTITATCKEPELNKYVITFKVQLPLG